MDRSRPTCARHRPSLAEATQRGVDRSRGAALSVVDASVWVSALVVGDIHHAESRRWLEQHASDELLVAPSSLLPGIASAVSRTTGRSLLARRAVRLLARLPALRIVAVDAELTEAAARVAGHQRPRAADSVYVALAKRLSLPLVTWLPEQA